jgi:hypothetical protein
MASSSDEQFCSEEHTVFLPLLKDIPKEQICRYD